MNRRRALSVFHTLVGAVLVGSGVVTVVAEAASPAAAVPRLTAKAAAGCTKLWVAPLSGDWNDASNWSPAGIPASTDNVCITAAGSYTVTASYYENTNSLTLGGAGSTPTLALDPGHGITVSASSTLESGSSVTVIGSGVASYLDGKANITNDAGVTVAAGAALDIGGTDENGTFTNTAQGSVTDNGAVDVLESFADSGPITVANGATWAVGEGPTFVHSAGVITNNGSFTTSGNNLLTWTQSGGSVTGNAIGLRSTTFVDRAGTGAFDDTYNNVVSGTVPAGQSIRFEAGLIVATGTTLINKGTLECAGTAGGAGNVIGNGTAIDNAGKLVVDAGASCDVSLPLINESKGKFDISGNLYPSDPVVNDGAVSVESGGTLELVGQSESFANDPTGTVTNDGAFEMNGSSAVNSFTSDGTLKGTQPILLINCALDDQAGAGAFILYGTVTVTGTVPAGQTLAVRGTAGYGNGYISLGGATLTNDGTITLGTVNGSYAWMESGGSGGAMVNNGTVVLLGPPTGVNAQGDVLDVPVTNDAGGTILVLTPNGYLGAPNGYGSGVTLTNDGALTFSGGAQLALEGGVDSGATASRIVSGPDAVLTVTIDGETGAPAWVPAIVQGAYGPVGTLKLDGTFDIITLGLAPSGDLSVTTDVDISARFTVFDFGARAYKVIKTTSALMVKKVKPFTLTPDNVTGTAGQSLTATLASLASNASATYQVSVSWGDGATSAGSFTAGTGGGTVSGTHTYASAGTYPVKVTVASSTGTTKTSTSTATISG